MIAVWHFPTKILYGEGSIAACGAEVAALAGTRVLVVTDPGVAAAGLVEDVGKSLRKSKVAYECFEGVSSNPQEVEVLQAAEMFRRVGADAVVALGGGSAIDVGKLVRLAATHPLPLALYATTAGSGESWAAPLPPMVAIPTTAGTGSEVGWQGVVTLQATGRKASFSSSALLPNVAILDPELTLSLTPAITAATGFEALTRCIEAYCVDCLHPLADAIAARGIALVAKYLARAVAQGDDRKARGAMLQAAMMAGVAAQKGAGACHALANPLASECELHQGLASALCLPAVIDFNRSTASAKVARVAQWLGVRADDPETLAFECSGAVRALRARLALPEGLAAASVDAGLLSVLSAAAMEDAAHLTNPRPCTQEDMLAIYRASM